MPKLHRLLLLDLQVAKLQSATVAGHCNRGCQKQPFTQELNVIFEDYRQAHAWHVYHAPPQLPYVIVPKLYYKMPEIERSRRFPTAETTTAELTKMVQASQPSRHVDRHVWPSYSCSAVPPRRNGVHRGD